MAPTVRPLTEKENLDLVTYAKESRDFLGSQLNEIHTKVAEFWKIYLAKREDKRDPLTEKWRSNIVVPQATLNTEAKVAQQVEILFAPDPPIQADPVFESGEANARGIEQLLEYTLRINTARTFMAKAFRSTSIQGTEFFKTTWKKRQVQIPFRASQQQVTEFQKAVSLAEQAFSIAPDRHPDWMTDPEAFEEWRGLINKAHRGVEIPEAPDFSGQPQELVTFWGPYFERIPIWQLFIDPLVESLCDQPIIIHEMFKPRSWVESMTGDDPRKPYDPKRVAQAIDGWYGTAEGQDRQQDVNTKFGIPQGIATNPQYFRPVKIWEVWRLNSQHPFCVILNETQVINKNPSVLPFEHGQAPFGSIRNLLVPGMAYGFSDIEPARTMLEEQNTLRSLRLDKVTLHTIPAFQKLLSLGIPELQKQIAPGAFVDVNKIDGIKPLIPGDINPSAYSEGDRISIDIDRMYGIGDNVRGATANVGRVSATAEAGRLNQALVRIKMSVVQAEDDLTPVVQQWLGLWAQFGTEANRPTLSGYDPMANLDRNKLLTALAMNYRFRGATQAIQKELQAQQLMMFGKEFQAVMTPAEVRSLMREVAQAMNLRSISKIVSPEGDQIVQQQYKQQAAAQAEATKAQGQVNKVASAATEVPNEVVVEEGGQA